MNTTQLLEFFHRRKEILGEKATKLNMFLEGYGVGIMDNGKAFNAGYKKALEDVHNQLDNLEELIRVSNGDWEYVKEQFINSIK